MLLNVIRLYPLVKLRLAIEQVKVALRFWRKAPFLRDDLRLSLSYLGKNPYRICRRYLQQRGATNIHTYGETPLTTLARITKWAGISQWDVVYDLGCGPGRTSLWLSHFIGCRVLGIELIPEFVRRAKRLESRRLRFRQLDMLSIDYSTASVVYLYGTMLEEGEIRQLLKAFQKLPRGAKVITVSYPLTDYDPNGFKLVDSCTVPYTWGKAEVYLQGRAP